MMSLIMMMMCGNSVVFCIPLWGLGLQDGKVRPLLFLFPAPAHAAHPQPAQSLFSAFFPQMGAVPALCRGCTSVEAPSCYYCCPRPRPQGVRVHLVGGWEGGGIYGEGASVKFGAMRLLPLAAGGKTR